MRDFDGSLFEVAWAWADWDADVLDLGTPFRSGRNDPWSPFDTGAIGEIPEYAARRSRASIPARVCRDCWVGDDAWWENGWPIGTPPVVLAPDGWAVGCSGGPPVAVTSVGLAMPPQFVVTGSPVTTIGTLAADWIAEAPNLFLASPDGAAGLPDFRPIVVADLPGLPASIIVSGLIDTARLGTGSATGSTYLAGDQTWKAITSGTVTSVGVTVPSWMTATGSPVTSSGTIALDTASAAANRVLASPDGSAGQLSPRALVAADLPGLPGSKITSGGLSAAYVDTGTLPLAVIPVLTSAQLPAGSAVCTLTHATATTTASYATLWTRTSASGLHGVVRLRNNGTGSMNYRWTVTDAWTGTPVAGTDQTLTASASVLWPLDNPGLTGFPGSPVQPFTTLLLEVKTAPATPAQAVELYASTVG